MEFGNLFWEPPEDSSEGALGLGPKTILAVASKDQNAVISPASFKRPQSLL